MLEIRSLSKSFQEADQPVRVLDSLDLQLEAGETAALLGESGSGKTTLLNLISGLDRPNAGEILIDSESTQDFNDVHWNEMRRQKLGLVFQQYHLVPTLSVSDNLKLQARLVGRLNLELFDFLESNSYRALVSLVEVHEFDQFISYGCNIHKSGNTPLLNP